jgi:hypothetical protein
VDGHSGILGTRWQIVDETMLEPTYVVTVSAGNVFHTVMLRWQQVLTPQIFMMIKNSYALGGKHLDSRSNTMETYCGVRTNQLTAFHFGYRVFYDFEKLNTHGLWCQVGRQLPMAFTVTVRYRRYFRTDALLEDHSFASDNVELRIVRSPLAKSGLMKNLTGSLVQSGYRNDNEVMAYTIGFEMNLRWPMMRKN